MNSKPVRLSCLPWLLAMLSVPGALSAQRTWIVDAAGGAGAQFRDLPPAVAAASDGDTILIRPASTSYGATTISKALRIVGTGIPVVLGGAPLEIHGLSAAQSCSITNLWLEPTSSHLRVAQCSGSVTVAGLAGGVQLGVAAQVLGSRAVRFETCVLEGQRPGGLEVYGSSVTCTQCVIRGLDVWQVPASGAVGIYSAESRLTLVACAVFGGRVLATPSAQQPAVVVPVAGGSTIVTGGSVLVGGGAVAFSGAGTDLTLESTGALVGSIAGQVRTTIAQVPALLSEYRNGALDLVYRGSANDTVALFVSVPTNPMAVSFGELWLDPARALLVDLGVASGGSRRVAAPWAQTGGLHVAAQAAVLRAGSLQLTNPVAIDTP